MVIKTKSVNLLNSKLLVEISNDVSCFEDAIETTLGMEDLKEICEIEINMVARYGIIWAESI